MDDSRLFNLKRASVSYLGRFNTNKPKIKNELCGTFSLHSQRTFVTLFGKTDTNTFPFKRGNRLLSVIIRLIGSCKHLNGVLIRVKKKLHLFHVFVKTFKRFAYPFKRKASSCLELRAEL